ncbi:MAG: 16S rRNA (adenine(1518)-N(6)/adenine(1519)-N(6))-dimethyltransferase RsmA, partial [Bacteroidales bacterium]|nr:16S rRNA (adenine(1518)-N(6)/adenine(1519)-N(6))-dimethyltransferase RsmA [Bacteroidales bacterium]
MPMVRPKKHLGQHFLTDHSIAGRIVDALNTSSGDKVIEIGPGTGILTGPLLEKDIQLLPVEIDSESVVYLKQKWPVLEDLIIEKDFLKMNIDDHITGSFHVIGNFPYNISSQIFFRVLEYRQRVPSMVCMIQKEVANRIASPPGSKEYGILSVLLQAYFDIENLFTVKPGSFFPPPKVTSGVIRLTRNKTVTLTCDEKLFFKVIKTTFNQRRKMIRNSIKSILLNLDSDFELLSKRPEQLGVPEFIELTNWVESQQTAE